MHYYVGCLEYSKRKYKCCFINAKAYYVVPIKANHPLFYQDLQDYFDDDEQNLIIGGKPNTAYKKEYEYKNGSAITYEYFRYVIEFEGCI